MSKILYGQNRPIFLNETGSCTDPALNAVGDYSTTPVEICVQCETGHRLVINRLFITISDSGSDASGYGNIGELTNGIRFYTKDVEDNIIQDRSQQLLVKSNTEWCAYCHDYTIETAGGGPDVVRVAYDFTGDGAPIILEEGEKYCILLQDDFNGLNKHYFKVGAVAIPITEA